jgi:branched-chain amino acid transport system permease protein
MTGGAFGDLLQHLVQGLSLGSCYALIALGYTMVYGVLQFINFAHSDVFMLGAYFAFYGALLFSKVLGGAGVAGGAAASTGSSLLLLAAVLVFSMAACGLVGFVIERLAYRPLRSSPRLTVLITAIGVSLLLENGGQLIFGAAPRSFPRLLPEQSVFTAGRFTVTNLQVIGFTVSILLMAALQWLVYRTRFGMAIRAISQNPTAAALMGINVDRAISLTFVIGSALAAAAGVLIGTSYGSIRPDMGIAWGLKAFVAAVIGGIGHIPGAMAGGLLLGVAEELVATFASSFRDAIAFGVLILILLFRPAGLFGKATVEKV